GGAGDGREGQIAGLVSAEDVGHFGLHFVGQPAPPHDAGGKQLVDGGHVDAVEAGSDDGGTGDSDMNLLGSPRFPDAAEQDPHGGGADDGILDEEYPLPF